MTRVIEVKAPDTFSMSSPFIRVFLAGSIEMGAAELWQDKVVKYLRNNVTSGVDVVVYNPRRDDWDSSWIQDPSNGTPFHTQVSWELTNIRDADIVFFYFDPNTKSPISLMELGIVSASDQRVIVVCSPEFYRYGNVKILIDNCEEMDFPSVLKTMSQGLEMLLSDINQDNKLMVVVKYPR